MTCWTQKRKFFEEIVYRWKLRKLIKQLRRRKEEKDAAKEEAKRAEGR